LAREHGGNPLLGAVNFSQAEDVREKKAEKRATALELDKGDDIGLG